MIPLILVVILLLVVLGSIGMGMIIIYHFKRLGMRDDDNVRRFLLIFKLGGLIIVAASVFLLFLVII